MLYMGCLHLHVFMKSNVRVQCMSSYNYKIDIEVMHGPGSSVRL